MKKIYSCIITIFVVMFLSVNVFASYSVDYSWPVLPDQWSIKYYYSKYSNSRDWTSRVSSGVGAWNSSSAKLYMYNWTSSSKDIYIYSSRLGNIGFDARARVQNNPLLFIIAINDSSGDAWDNGPELVAHELGHVFRLNDVTDTNVLMRNRGYKGSKTPTKDDLTGVSKTYK